MIIFLYKKNYFVVFFFSFLFSAIHLTLVNMSLAASREPRLSKPGPSIADPSNIAAPATVSHRAAAAAAAAAETDDDEDTDL